VVNMLMFCIFHCSVRRKVIENEVTQIFYTSALIDDLRLNWFNLRNTGKLNDLFCKR